MWNLGEPELLRVEPCGGCPKPPRSFIIGRTTSVSFAAIGEKGLQQKLKLAPSLAQNSQKQRQRAVLARILDKRLSLRHLSQEVPELQDKCGAWLEEEIQAKV